jgi:general secretion pathway protein D
MKESNPRTDAAQKRFFRQRKCLTLLVCAALVCLFFGAYTLLTNALAHDVAGQAYTLPRSPAAPAAAVVMKIDPATTYKDPGETFSVTVKIENVVDFGAFQFELTYDSAVVTATNVTSGTFLGSTGRSVYEVGPTYGIESVAYGAYTLGDGDGPNGSGILAAITFQATSVGTSTLHLQDILATDTDGTTLFPTANDGEVIVGDVYPPPLVTSISPPWGYSGTVMEDVIVEGENFQEDASVQLTRTDENSIPAPPEDVQSSTRISCTLNLGKAVAGQWNVVVTNPDGQSGTLPNGFTVNGLVYLPIVLKND